MKTPIKVIIVDDHDHFRDILKIILRDVPSIEIIGETSNGDQFIELINEITPDIVLMDIEMPEMNGIETTKFALQNYPDLKIIAMTLYDDKEYYNEIKKSGFKGYVSKANLKEEVFKAIEQVYAGHIYFNL